MINLNSNSVPQSPKNKNCYNQRLNSKNILKKFILPQNRVYEMKENSHPEINNLVVLPDIIETGYNNIITDNSVKVEKTLAISKSTVDNRVQK